jgi:peptidoglycan/xylan/chitin deacetylase (PgdA/CDA1 family)
MSDVCGPKVIAFALGLMVIISSASAADSWIRINQLGYLEKDIKVAVLVTKGNERYGSFAVHDALTGKVVFSGTKIRSFGPYAAFSKGYRLDFSAFTRPGKYFLKAGGTQSPVFRIGNDVYDGTADFILQYMRQQRSKYNPFLKDSCHTHDGFIVYHPDRTKDSTRLDVSGGWHDASDYLQYLPTSANACYQMMFAYRMNPGIFGDEYDAWGNKGSNGIPDIIDEAKWGLDWLVKMNPGKEEYYNQLADDRDHRGLRLPTLDSVKYATNQGLARPVYFITGKPQGEKYKNRTTGVASSAGKFASAFALGAEVMRTWYPEFASSLVQKAKDAYAFGKKYPGNTQTISMVSPYIYAEDNDVDDMQLAALTLYGIEKKNQYLQEGIQFARKEPVTPWMGADTANHYQWYPFVNLGHYLGASEKSGNTKEYLTYMKEGIERVKNRGANNPFLMGVPFIWCSNNLVVAILTQLSLYKNLTGSGVYDEQEAALRDWLFGCNPWGTSMICDLPENGVAPKDPHSAFTHLYNYKISGGLVDGPVYGSIWNRLIGIKLYSPDEFETFQSPLVIYHDDFGDYSSNEPTMDGTASLSYYLSALQARGGGKAVAAGFQRDSEGAVVRFRGNEKKVYLLFSAHDQGEGGGTIARALKQHGVKASFFFTGDFLRNPNFRSTISELKKQGNYIGVHSDKHLLYADWTRRDSLLVSRQEFVTDLERSQQALRKLSLPVGKWFLPPYEWYNREVVKWAADKDLTVINFTPGTGTNADYTWPGMSNYKSSDELMTRLFEKEKQGGLSGALILIHLGTDARRTDKFYDRLGELIGRLKGLGYSLDRLP